MSKTKREEVFQIYDDYISGMSLGRLAVKYSKCHRAIARTLDGLYHKEFYTQYEELFPEKMILIQLKRAK